MNYKKISDKALEMALKSLEKDYGKDFASQGLQTSEYKAIPTGYDDLDAVLTRGNGGIYLGGVCELYGGEGSGKCVTQDTLCLTPNGFMTIEEIFEQYGHKCDSTKGFIEEHAEIYNGLQFEETSHFYKNGSENLKTKRISTKEGFVIEGTPNHPVLVMNKHGFVVWKQLSKLEIGDYVCIARNMRVWNEGRSITESEAVLLGRLLSGGFSDAIESMKLDKINYKTVKNEFVSQLCEKYNFQLCNVQEKRIPSFVLQASRLSQTAFIRSYFDWDGIFQHEKGNIQFCSESIEMLRTLQLMLLNFGIYAYINHNINNDDYHYYELVLAGEEVERYYNKIGFNPNPKCDAIVEVIKNKSDKIYNDIDIIPYQKDLLESLYSSIGSELRSEDFWFLFKDVIESRCDLTYSQLGKIVQWCLENSIDLELFHHFRILNHNKYIYSAVSKIEDQENKTFDFTLPKTHTFWSNGFISHNTSLAMRTVGMAQSEGLVCAWFDAEHSFSPDLAQLNRMSLDGSKFVYFSRTTGEGDKARLLNAAEVLDRVYKAIWTGVFSLIVVDSVAALMPERIAADDFDPSKKGISELARDMSAQLPKISSACAEKECTAIFINQVRMKPGEIYGNPETTPGGRALKYYASQRIEVNKINGKSGQVIQTTEDGIEEIVGHYARVKVVKNRRNEPCFDTLEIPIYYREYFPDNAKKCYDLARKLQVITTRRGILTWKDNNGEIVAQTEGESRILEHIRDGQLEPFLAYCCVVAGEDKKNINKRNPVKVPRSIYKLAEKYTPGKTDTKKTTKKKTKAIDELLNDIDVADE